ncbi:MAG: GspH/FimT family pseudopilin [Gammaproteobacteria bacterium]|nr:GspH/FimT family pseudopilin [Gammaproteobacteria bacterium]
MKKTNQSGFTLYELLITVLVIGVILAMGVPNLREFRQNARMTSTANDLHSSFHLGRSEAVRAKTNITVCASANSMAANPVCGGKFVAGWIVFMDLDGDITVDAGETVLRSFGPAADQVVINTAEAFDYFSFASTGLGRGNVNGTDPVSTIMMCDDRGSEIAPGGLSTARVLVITPLGRATVLRKKEQVDFHGGC